MGDKHTDQNFNVHELIHRATCQSPTNESGTSLLLRPETRTARKFQGGEASWKGSSDLDREGSFHKGLAGSWEQAIRPGACEDLSPLGQEAVSS